MNYDSLKPTFFPTPESFRRWLKSNHTKRTELWVGYHKVDTGRPSITWPESVDEALCFGWIDGLRKSLGETSYMIRFTPRKPTSVWSKVNIAKVKKLSAEGRMTQDGLAVFNARKSEHAEGYSIRERRPVFPESMLTTFRKNKMAWNYFGSMPPGYKRTVTFWVISAKREETRALRLKILMKTCAERRRMDLFGRSDRGK